MPCVMVMSFIRLHVFTVVKIKHFRMTKIYISIPRIVCLTSALSTSLCEAKSEAIQEWEAHERYWGFRSKSFLRFPKKTWKTSGYELTKDIRIESTC